MDCLTVQIINRLLYSNTLVPNAYQVLQSSEKEKKVYKRLTLLFKSKYGLSAWLIYIINIMALLLGGNTWC